MLNETNRAIDDLNAVGFTILENLGVPEVMDRAAQELELQFGSISLADTRNSTRRVHTKVLADNPTLQSLVIDSRISKVLDALLLPNCVRYQLSSVQGIQVHIEAAAQELHRDDDIFLLPHPHPVFEVNVMWAVTDFTAANGATRIVPNSHVWPTDRTPQEEEIFVGEMSKGSALLWLGSTWHGAGACSSDDPRTGLYVGYSLGWLRQEETLYLALPMKSIRQMPERLQRLIGYEIKGSQTLGWLDGRDPRDALGL